MAVLETIDSHQSANSGKPVNSRGRVSSNIGVRRQQLSTLRGQNTIIREADGRTSYMNGFYRPGEQSTSRYGTRLPRQAALIKLHASRDITDSSTDSEYEAEHAELVKALSNGSETPISRRQSSDATSFTSGQELLEPFISDTPNPNILPVAPTEQARASFNFYVNSYVTSIIEVSPQSVGNYPQVVQQILHDELLFTAFTTCSEAARWRTQSLFDDPPIHIVKGYGKTISLLSQRLTAERFSKSPAVLLAMGQLTAIETLIKNVSATARHLAGMQSVVTKKPGFSPPEKPSPVQSAIEIWMQYFMYRAAIRNQVRRDKLVTYPSHPFDPQLSVQISELPAGLVDIALSTRISIEMLDLISKFNDYFIKMKKYTQEKMNDSAERTSTIISQAAYCIEYVQIRSLTILDRLLLAALTAYVVRRDRIHPALINIRNYFQITCGNLVNMLSVPGTSLHPEDQGSDVSIWIGLVLLLTSTPEAHARSLALKILPPRPEPLRSLKICKTFFWDDDLTNALVSGGILTTAASNDVLANNVEQAIPESESP